jgi:hypothetical protein
MGLNNRVTIRLSDDKRDKLNDLAGRMKIPPFSEFLGKRFPAFFTPALDDAKFVLNAFIRADQRPEIIAWCFFDAEPAEFKKAFHGVHSFKNREIVIDQKATDQAKKRLSGLLALSILTTERGQKWESRKIVNPD